jgi:hypothetical protein
VRRDSEERVGKRRGDQSQRVRGKSRGIRLDELVVARGFAETNAQARGMIMAGEILTGDRRLDKAGENMT